MPTHTIPSGFIKLYQAIPGAPWDYEQWKSITGVRRGLFHQDPSLLPSGWTPQTAEDVSIYFELYTNQRNEEQRRRFAASRKSVAHDNVRGRAVWRDFILEGVKIWDIHGIISRALSDNLLHPFQHMKANKLRELPASFHMVDSLHAIGGALFGDEALDDLGRLLQPLREGTLIIAQRASEKIRRDCVKTMNTLERYEKEFKETMEKLQRNKPTAAQLNKLIRRVAEWKAMVAQWDDDENIAKVVDAEADLQTILEALGWKADDTFERVVRSKPSKVKISRFQRLAGTAEVAQVISLFETSFGQRDDNTYEDTIKLARIPFGEPIEGADPGVEIEYGMRTSELTRNLGFTDKELPYLFNEVRHINKRTFWDKDGPGFFDSVDPSELAPMALHWHQHAGVHAIVRKLTNTSREFNAPGVLLADVVGLGKTLLTLATVAFFIELGMRQDSGKHLPPLIVKQPYIGTLDSVPDLPTLINCPGTLIKQWLEEIHIAFKVDHVDIFVYPCNKADRYNFWKPESPFNTSNQPLRRRIILASHSSLLSDFSTIWNKGLAGAKQIPWDEPPLLPRAEIRKPYTLFGQNFLFTVIDETQCFRNYGARHNSANAIFKQSTMRIAATATPMQTSTRDGTSMGRIIGLPYFYTRECFDQISADAAELRRARVEMLGEVGGDNDAVLECQVAASRRLQARFDGRLLRRTGDSLDPDGEPLMSLPPMTITDAVVNLTPRELQYAKLSAEALENISSANARGISSDDFYTSQRMAATFPQPDPSQPIPTFTSLEEWEPVKSTKIDVASRIVVHLCTSDDAPMAEFENGAVKFPLIPTPSEGPPSRTRKILVYQEFTVFTPLLVNIFALRGIAAVAINGSLGYDQRAAVVAQFRNDPNCRVLIVSKVGTVGLNLTCADTMIFLDQQWSSAEDEQAYGRICRRGQEKPCNIIHIYAADSIDLFIAALARGKGTMLDAFVTNADGDAQKVLTLLKGGTLPDDDAYVIDEDDHFKADGDDEGAPSTTTGKGKGKPKAKAKTKKVEAPGIGTETLPSPSTGGKKLTSGGSKKPGKTKSSSNIPTSTAAPISTSVPTNTAGDNGADTAPPAITSAAPLDTHSTSKATSSKQQKSKRVAVKTRKPGPELAPMPKEVPKPANITKRRSRKQMKSQEFVKDDDDDGDNEAMDTLSHPLVRIRGDFALAQPFVEAPMERYVPEKDTSMGSAHISDDKLPPRSRTASPVLSTGSSVFNHSHGAALHIPSLGSASASNHPFTKKRNRSDSSPPERLIRRGSGPPKPPLSLSNSLPKDPRKESRARPKRSSLASSTAALAIIPAVTIRQSKSSTKQAVLKQPPTDSPATNVHLNKPNRSSNAREEFFQWQLARTKQLTKRNRHPISASHENRPASTPQDQVPDGAIAASPDLDICHSHPPSDIHEESPVNYPCAASPTNPEDHWFDGDDSDDPAQMNSPARDATPIRHDEDPDYVESPLPPSSDPSRPNSPVCVTQDGNGLPRRTLDFDVSSASSVAPWPTDGASASSSTFDKSLQDTANSSARYANRPAMRQPTSYGNQRGLTRVLPKMKNPFNPNAKS